MNRPMSSLHKSTQSVVDHWEEDKSKAAGFLRRCKVPVHCLRNEEHHDNDAGAPGSRHIIARQASSSQCKRNDRARPLGV
jgi:hypothetical protein